MDGELAGLAVRARGLVKRFGERTAVDHLDLDVPRGVCFGLLGPNGAGKTTTMRMVTCTSPPTSGVLEVLGRDVRRDRRQIKRRLGVVPQGMTLDTDLTVRENLLTFAGYHGVPRQRAQQRADELLGFVELADRAGDRPLDLSGGMQRRVLIARALVNDPELVVLDEPTTGLDPQARHHVWERLRSLSRAGKTLLLTTHYMDEAAQLCDELAIVDAGRVVALGTPRALVERHVAPRVVEVHSPDVPVTLVAAQVGTAARTVERVGDRVLVQTEDGQAVVARLRAAGVGDAGLLLRDATLEDVFLALTGHGLGEGP